MAEGKQTNRKNTKKIEKIKNRNRNKKKQKHVRR